MEKNGYPTVNSEKTIFMKREGEHFIIHSLFVYDLMYTTTSTKLKDEFLRKYSKDFNITGGGLMKTFLGMEVEQDNTTIKLHLDHLVRPRDAQRVQGLYQEVASTQACPDLPRGNSSRGFP
jgi:hypothetical protein